MMLPLGLFLQKGLKLEGHEVMWVGDGEAALEQARVLRPDLMVLDLKPASCGWDGGAGSGRWNGL